MGWCVIVVQLWGWVIDAFQLLKLYSSVSYTYLQSIHAEAVKQFMKNQLVDDIGRYCLYIVNILPIYCQYICLQFTYKANETLKYVCTNV